MTQLDPSNRDAWGSLGSARYMAGEFDAALAAWQKSLDLEPGALEYSNVGTAYYFLGRFADAASMYQRAVELAPKDQRFWGHLGDARAMLGAQEPARVAYATAAELARQNLSVDADDIETRVQLAGYDAHLDRPDLARSALAETLRLTPEDLYIYYDAAVAYTVLGMHDEALDALTTAVERGYPRHLVAADPQFESLRSLDRFSNLAR
jgi:tetratricopeptide (TPR) repeat protein